MNRRIYYDAGSGRIIAVTDGRETIEQDLQLYRIAGYAEGQTRVVELQMTAYALRNLKNYRIDLETEELVWSGEEPEPVPPDGGGGSGGSGIDAEARRLIDELTTEVGEVRQVAEQAKTQAVDGKAGLSSAITDMGVPAAHTDTFADLADKVRQIYNGRKVQSGNYASLAAGESVVAELEFVPSFYIMNAEGASAHSKVYHKDIAGLNYASGSVNATLSGQQLTIQNTGAVQTRNNINYFAVE